MSIATDIQQAGKLALEGQSAWLRRKDTITAIAVLVAYVAESSTGVDWSSVDQWLPTVGVWAIGLIGIGIHALTKGAVTPAVVEEMTKQAEYVGQHRKEE